MIRAKPWMDPALVAEMSMEIDAQLSQEQAYYYDKPYEWVLDHFPWREPGTPLENWNGPDEWQKRDLIKYGESIRKRAFNGVDPVPPYRTARATGHGIGKSTWASWIILFILSTRPRSKGVVTANTAQQLETKTWSELAKWLRLCSTGHWFKMTHGKGSMRLVHKEEPEYWRCDAMTCAKENADAFQGLHAATSTPFFIFDEASSIPQQIWDPAEGGLTDGEPAFFVFGNPTQNSGKFHQIFHGMRHRWDCEQIDSRTCKMSNKSLITEWEEDYGEDSDFFRVRVRGMFPRVGEKQLISQEAVYEARRRVPICALDDPLVIGLDVAREPAGDQSVFAFRKGLDARTHPAEKFRGADHVFLTNRAQYWIDTLKADALFIDATGGYGQAVVDQLHRLGYQGIVFGIKFGASASKPNAYANKRTEMWVRMRDHLELGLAIEDDNQLEQELVTPTYDFYGKREQLILEKKRDIKVRLGPTASPDWSDALALTFAMIVQRRSGAGGIMREEGSRVLSSHDPWANT